MFITGIPPAPDDRERFPHILDQDKEDTLAMAMHRACKTPSRPDLPRMPYVEPSIITIVADTQKCIAAIFLHEQITRVLCAPLMPMDVVRIYGCTHDSGRQLVWEKQYMQTGEKSVPPVIADAKLQDTRLSFTMFDHHWTINLKTDRARSTPVVH